MLYFQELDHVRIGCSSIFLKAPGECVEFFFRTTLGYKCGIMGDTLFW
jgi:hypothetical protein